MYKSRSIKNKKELENVLKEKDNIDKRINSSIERGLLRHYYEEKNPLDLFNPWIDEEEMIKTHFTLPKVILLTSYDIRDLVKSVIFILTKIELKPLRFGNYELIIKDLNQFMLLFKAYNWKTEYHNNLTSKNTLYIKFRPHEEDSRYKERDKIIDKIKKLVVSKEVHELLKELRMWN